MAKKRKPAAAAARRARPGLDGPAGPGASYNPTPASHQALLEEARRIEGAQKAKEEGERPRGTDD